MKRHQKSSIWVPAVILLALVILGVFLTPSDGSPPGWDETHITFASDEDMAAYCDWLVLDTEGLSITHAYRCLSFDLPQDVATQSWSFLQVSYLISNGEAELSMLVYPGSLDRTDGFPVKNLELQETTVNGTQVLFQEFDDRSNSFRALFPYEAYTYELTVSSPTHGDVLLDSLARILPEPVQASVD